MTPLPQDPAILLSLVNTWLRDRYPSLEALCDDREITRGELEQRLAAAGFEYDAAKNRFW